MKIATGTQTMRLPDGRILSYAEYGNPNGTPVLFCHGHPGSRLQAQYLDETAGASQSQNYCTRSPWLGFVRFQISTNPA